MGSGTSAARAGLSMVGGCSTNAEYADWVCGLQA